MGAWRGSKHGSQLLEHVLIIVIQTGMKKSILYKRAFWLVHAVYREAGIIKSG